MWELNGAYISVVGGSPEVLYFIITLLVQFLEVVGRKSTGKHSTDQPGFPCEANCCQLGPTTCSASFSSASLLLFLHLLAKGDLCRSVRKKRRF